MVKIPAPTPKSPGFIMPDNIGELYSLGQRDHCGEWCISNWQDGGNTKVFCDLPNDHEYRYKLPHINILHSKAWRQGQITDVWYKEKKEKKSTHLTPKVTKASNDKKEDSNV